MRMLGSPAGSVERKNCWVLSSVSAHPGKSDSRSNKKSKLKKQFKLGVNASINCDRYNLHHGAYEDSNTESLRRSKWRRGRAKEHFRRAVQRGIKDGNTGWRYKYLSILDRWEEDAEYRASLKSRTCYKGRRGNMVRFDPQPRQEG